jgi:excisionase family DNA binding protein
MTDVDDEAITLPMLSGEPRCGTHSGHDAPVPQRRVHPPRGTEPTSSVLTVDELAALLRVNRKTVYDALSRGEIPGARRIGSTYRILRHAVLEWLASSQDRVPRSRRNR